MIDIDTVYTKAANQYNVPEALIRSLEYVESKRNIKAYNRRTHDYCSMQINVHHVMKANLDAYRLLNDHGYCVSEGTRVFAWFYKRYKHDEAIMRYNCGTKSECIKSFSSIKYLKQVKRGLNR